MKTKLVFCCAASLVASLLAADSTPKDEIAAAAKKLADKPNYTWKTTVAVPESTQFRPGPTEGKTEKDGFTYVKTTRRDSEMEFVIKGDKAAMTDPDGTWMLLSEMDDSEGPGRFLSRLIRNFKAPAAQAGEIAAAVKELKKEGDVCSGELTEEGAKSLLLMGGRGSDATASKAKGSAKFWVKDGVLSKYEFKVTGVVSFNGNDRDVDRTTTVEIKDVGTTKVELPEGAKKKLS